MYTAKHPTVKPVAVIAKIWLYPEDMARLQIGNDLNCKVSWWDKIILFLAQRCNHVTSYKKLRFDLFIS